MAELTALESKLGEVRSPSVGSRRSSGKHFEQTLTGSLELAAGEDPNAPE